HFGAVRRARRLLAGEPLTYARRMTGRTYASATIAAGPRLTDRVTLVCGDALDPPVLPGVFDRVVALNVLDSVRSPRQLLAVMDGLCAPAGELILSSPYTWQSSVMDDSERLGGADPAGEVVRLLTTGEGLGARYVIEDEADLPWTLRRDARNAVAYCIHYVRARRVPRG
ncbi:MAG: methyltransferase domain-containing protein, partial [Myxococcota bacterium]|nr:methyltransferase domain-containing protein [Myxococcota bacterium]